MTGAEAFRKRVGHSLSERPDGTWYVTLYLPDRDYVCPPGDTVSGAVQNAMGWLATHHPGKTI